MDQAIERSKRNFSTRVVGGTRAYWQTNRWQVALVWAGSSNNLTAEFCGGSIIAKDWVVTAAHCIDTTKPENQYEVLSGTDSLISGGVRSKVYQYYVHERFSTNDAHSRHDYDIALIKIDETKGPPLKGEPIRGLTGTVATQLAGKKLRMTGWGAIERDNQGLPTIFLQGVDVSYVETSVCNEKKSYDNAITDRMLCAGEQDGGVDTCQGDSGGPATLAINGVQLLAGITSWGDGCGDADLYGVYTNVSTFREWINQKTSHSVNW